MKLTKHRTTKHRILFLFLGFLTALLWFEVVPALAQDAPKTEAVGGVTPNDVNEVARELWCPLCSGVRLDACELKACDQMKDMIAIKLAEGENTESIKAYFIEQYGPQVLGEPPREGFNWLAWILPFVALILGAFVLWRQVSRRVRPAPQAAADDQASSASAERNRADDEYAAKLDEELAKYG